MIFREQRIATNGTELVVATAGEGPAALLIHGWPHDWRIWKGVGARLADRGYRVIAPNLRGIGGSTSSDSGYDIATLADDMAGIIAALGIDDALVAGLDAGAPVGLMLAFRHRARVRCLALSESLIGDLTGAEDFLARGAPWWFGFHAIPGLAESVVEGRETQYLTWFYDNDGNGGRNVTADLRTKFVAAYTGRTALRSGFELYRTLPANARLIRDAIAEAPLSMPVLAMTGGVVGDAIARQLKNVATDLKVVPIEGAGHLVPLDQPDVVARVLVDFDRRA